MARSQDDVLLFELKNLNEVQRGLVERCSDAPHRFVVESFLIKFCKQIWVFDVNP